MGIHENIKACEADLKPLSEKISNLQKVESGLRKKIAELKNLMKEPTVTDHALVRYFERHFKVNMEEIRAAILSDVVVAAMAAGAKKVKSDGMEYVIKEKAVVTIVPLKRK